MVDGMINSGKLKHSLEWFPFPPNLRNEVRILKLGCDVKCDSLVVQFFLVYYKVDS